MREMINYLLKCKIKRVDQTKKITQILVNDVEQIKSPDFEEKENKKISLLNANPFLENQADNQLPKKVQETYSEYVPIQKENKDLNIMNQFQIVNKEDLKYIYIYGVFDLFNIGDAQIFAEIKNENPNSILIVGLVSDEDALKYFDIHTILDINGRSENLKHCKFVDRILENVDPIPSEVIKI